MSPRSALTRLVAATLTLLLGACTDIPTSGPVTEVTVSAEGRGVQIAPEPPQKGMSASRIVEGFLQAMADPTSDYEVARQYLVSSVRGQWAPRRATVVYDGWVEAAGDGLELRGTTRGTVDAVGRFTVSRESLTHDFGLVQEAGEWRVSAPPEGVLLSSYIFARSYNSARSYFIARSGQAVVPEPLHLPASEITPGRIVEAQLAGPGTFLSSGVRNAIPAGTGLGAAGAVVDSSGVVTVALEGVPQGLGDVERRELGAQLLWSLSSIPKVSGLHLVVDGRPYPLPGQNDKQVLELSSQQDYQPLSKAGSADLYGVHEGRAGKLSADTSFIPLTSDGAPAEMTAISLDGAFTATVAGSPATVRIGPSGGVPVQVDTGLTRVGSVHFAQGRLWLLGRGSSGEQRLLSVSPQGEAATIDLSALPGEVVDLSLDASGTRAAVLLGIGGATRFGAASLIEGNRMVGWQEVPLTVSQEKELSDAVALDWTGEVNVAVVASAGSGSSVFVVAVDGSEVTDLGPVSASPIQVTALPRPGGDAVAVRAADGTVLLYEQHGTWQQAKTAMTWISYPG